MALVLSVLAASGRAQTRAGSGLARALVTANLAPDSDFESDPGSSYFTNGPGTFTWATDQSHSATHSLKIVSSSSTESRWLSNTNAIAATPGTQYTACAYLKTDGVGANAAYLAVNFWTTSNTYIPATVTSPVALSGTTDWAQVCLTTTAPAGAAFLRLEFRLDSPGTLWADDVSVFSGGGTSTPPPSSSSAPVASGNTTLGSAVSTTTGAWSNSPSRFDYQWFACSDGTSVPPSAACSDIVGATSSMVTLAPAQLGKWVLARVQATNGSGTGTAYSNAVGPVAMACPATPAGAIDFEPPAYSTGNIDGQQGWTKSGSYDAAVAGVAGFPNASGFCFGSQALRLSNAVTSGAFGDQTFSPAANAPAGESAANNHFEASFEIGATQASQQPGLFLSVSPDDGHGGRMSYVGFDDQPDGIHVIFDDVHQPGPCTPSGCANFVQHDVGTLDRTRPHSIRFVMDFLPGPGNDVVKLYVDGALAITGTSWEDYYRYDPEQAGSGHVVPAVQKLLVREGGTAAPATSGNGYLIDDVTLASSSVGTATNLAADPDFESDPSSSYFTNGTCSFSWTTEASRSPSHSLKIASSTSGLCRWLSNTGSIPATPGTTYNASVYLKPVGVAAAGSARLALLFYSGSTFTGSSAESPSRNGTSDWTQASAQATAPAGTTSMRLEVRLNGPGTLYADDIFVAPSSGNPPSPPGVNIVSTSPGSVGATGSSTITWNGTVAGTFSVRLGGATCSEGTVLGTGTYSSPPANATATVNATDLAAGANTIRICLTDGTGNTGSATTTVTKDLNAPVVTIVSALPGTINASGSTTVTWNASKNGSFTVRVGGTSCTTGTEVASGAYTGSPANRTTTIAGSALPSEGANVVRVCVTDSNGNVGSAETTVVRDTVAPTVTIVSAVPSTVDGAPSSVVTWRGTENGSFSVLLGGSNCSNGMQLSSGGYSGSPGDTTSSVSSSALALGDNTIRVCLTDPGGNVGSATVTIQKVGSGGGTGSNLAPDADFEQNPNPFYSVNGPCTFSWSTQQAHSPTHSLEIVSPASNLCRWFSNTTGTTAVAGTVYFASIYVKTVAVGVAGQIAIAINFWNSSGGYLGVTYQSAPLIGTNDWTLQSVQGTAPAGTKYVRVEYRFNGPGTAYFDDALLIATNGINDPPTFDLPASPNQSVLSNAGQQTVASFATNISPGPPDEASQHVTFLVSNDNNGLFTTQPAISPSGTLTYTPNPSASGTATVTVQAKDDGGTAGGGNDTSAPKTFTITTTPPNQAPVLANIESSALAYTENDPPTPITSTLTVSDADSPNLAGATVSITGNFASGEDVLAFTSQNGITGSYDAATGVLTLSGSASVASYQAALRSVAYQDTSDKPSTAPRTVSIRADDGAAVNHLSNVVAREVDVTAVNDAPVLAGIETTPLSYTQSAPAAPITSTLTVSDVDSANLAGATVSITSGFQPFEDVLGFTNQNGITGSYNAETGVLTLSGTASVANYQSALRSVAYSNNTASSTATRTVSFQVDDGSASHHASNVVTRDVQLTALNRPPTDIQLAPTSVPENMPPATTVGTFTTTDPDGGSHTYSLLSSSASCAGVNDTADFAVNGSALVTERTFDFETQPTSYTICVRSTDDGTPVGTFDRQFTVTITNADDAPTDIALSSSSIPENQPAGTPIGNFSATDQDVGQSHTFSLPTTGCGGGPFPDNASFAIAGDVLQSAVSFDHETKSSYAICVRTTDAGGLTFDKQFTIAITNVVEPPTAVDDTATVLEDSGANPVDVLANDSDPDSFGKTITAVTQGATGTVAITGGGSGLTYTPNTDSCGPDSFTYTLGGGSVGSVSVTVTCVNDAPSFVKGADVTNATNQSAYTQAGWATAISAGPTNESGQTVNFVIDNVSDPSLFSVQPAVSPTGTLTFTPDTTKAGTATVTLHLHDSGGTANGGIDVSPTQSFTITTVLPAPVAANDSYTATGNVGIDVSSTTDGVLHNDTPNGGTLSKCGSDNTTSVAVSSGSCTTASASGGSVVLSTDGTFTYDPPAGFTGTDHFFYKLSNSGGDSSAADVSVAVSNMIWFFDASAGSAGDGRLSHPFKAISSFVNDGGSGHGKDGQTLFVAAGSYTSGLTLRNSQILIGKGASASIASISGITLAPHSDTLPSTGGTAPSLTTTTGSANAITLGSDNTIRGLGIGDTTGAGISGLNFGTLSASEVDITGAGTALSLSNGTLNGTFGTVSSTSGSNGVRFFLVGGTANLGTGALSGSSMPEFYVEDSGGSFTYGGTVSNSSNHTVYADGDSGSISLSGSITDTGLGVHLTNNTGTTITFSGKLDLSTGSNAAFTATGGGTVTATGSGSTLATTTGTALDVENTTIGSDGLTFQSISSNGASRGILLSDTGTSGSLAVSGNGGTCTSADKSGCSGGEIKSSAGADDSGSTPVGAGIVLSSTKAPSFTRIYVHDSSNYGIRGSSVDGFTLANSVVAANGTTTASPYTDASVAFTNLSGSASVSNSAISGGATDNFRIDNTNVSLDRATFDTDAFGDNSTIAGSGDSLLIESEAGSGALKATVENSTFTGAASDLVNFNHNATGAGDLVLSGNHFSNSHPGIATGGGGLTLTTGGSAGTATMSITNNTFRDAVGHAILVVKETGNTTQSGTFSGNTVGVSGIANSGSSEGSDLKLQTVGQGTMTWAVTNNTFYGYNNNGVEVEAGGSASTESGNLNTTITGNTIAQPGNTTSTIAIPKNGIHLNIGTVPGDTYAACAAIGGAGTLANAISTSGKDAVPATIGDLDFRLRQRQATTIRLPGYGGANNDNTAVQNFVAGNNSDGGTPVGLAQNTVPTGGGYVGGAACPAP